MAARDLERRCAAQRIDPLTIRDTPSHACDTCGGIYLDSDDGHDAHQVVFGHRPQRGEA